MTSEHNTMVVAALKRCRDAVPHEHCGTEWDECRCVLTPDHQWPAHGCLCGRTAPVQAEPLDTDTGEDQFLDPCDFCGHETSDHAGDGCRDCPCDAPA